MGGWKFQKHSERASAKKRRRRGSRSVFGKKSERSGTWRCCSVGTSAGRPSNGTTPRRNTEKGAMHGGR
ncbi:hypothetical protein D8674_011947 [Pyrus ussuriensis x Pyrus communis]|uniref:Uncharacterized protein n=1 Tax=Pyrus ussuriensis x Pyrus communis TaxID=2448454 RepID=A0A5N5G044_9ROSA|nr:hypothetical protein D8674_011947 [Pyrus ussuriensis x Pyrus communis]